MLVKCLLMLLAICGWWTYGDEKLLPSNGEESWVGENRCHCRSSEFEIKWRKKAGSPKVKGFDLYIDQERVSTGGSWRNGVDLCIELRSAGIRPCVCTQDICRLIPKGRAGFLLFHGETLLTSGGSFSEGSRYLSQLDDAGLCRWLVGDGIR